MSFEGRDQARPPHLHPLFADPAQRALARGACGEVAAEAGRGRAGGRIFGDAEAGHEDAGPDVGARPLGVEGRQSSRWVLLDFASVIVHVFAPDEREFYGLERLWGKAAQVVRVV